jgi:HEAT repeat protein
VIDPLLNDLASASTHARCRAALELGTRADPAAAEALMAAFTTESDDYVRETLVRALVRVGDHVVDPLISLLTADNRQLRHHAAHALSKLRDTRAVDPLIAAFGDPDSFVVYKAAFALGRIGDPRAIGSLIVLLDHTATEVRSAASDALEMIGQAAVPALVGAFDQGSAMVREQVVYLLGTIAPPVAEKIAHRAAQDDTALVRIAGLTTLAKVTGDETVRAAASAALNDSDAGVRAFASRLLRQ